jgi:ABC-type transporter Mla subunit MlaD
MKDFRRELAVAAGIFIVSFAAAQPAAPPAQGQRPPTVEERVLALERGLATVTTRFEARDAAAVSSSSTTSLETRVVRLEQTLDRLAQDLQRADRAADNAQRAADAAARDAADARRTAQDAERVARDVQMRVH